MEPRKFTLKATGTTAKSYDFGSARRGKLTTYQVLLSFSKVPPTKTANRVIESTGHLAKCCLGGGVVTIHESYMHCGLFSAFILNAFLGMFVAYSMHVLVKSAQTMYGRLQQPSMSYPDLAEASLETGPFPRLRKYSKCFRYAVDVLIGFNLFGSCCVYTVIMAKSISQLIGDSGAVAAGENLPLRAYVACLLVPCLLITMITSLKYLAPFSIVADFFILTVAISTINYGITHSTKSPGEFPVFKGMVGLLQFMGVCVFSMEGFGAVLTIENNMAQPRKFYLVLIGGMSVVTSIVMTIGFFGYWGFGENAQSPVTLNFPWAPFPIILKVFMALMIYVTFALNFYCPFDLVWVYIKKRHPPEKYWFWERVYRAIIVCGIVTVAIIFPNVGSFLGLLGSFCISNIGFIFPAFIQLVVQYEDPGLGYMKWRLIRFLAVILFGTCLCILGTYLNAKKLIESVT